MIAKIKQIIKRIDEIGFFHLLTANSIVLVTGFGLQIAFVKILSVEDVGNIKLFKSYFSILYLVCCFGVDVSILKLCSQKISGKEKEHMLMKGFKLALVNSVLYGLIAFGLIVTGVLRMNDIVGAILIWHIIIMPLLIMNNTIFAFFQSQRKIKLISNFKVGLKLVAFLVIVLLVYFHGLKGYIYGVVATTLLDSFIYSLLLYRTYKIRIHSKILGLKVGHIRHMSKHIFVANAMGQVVMSSDIIILNYMVNDANIIGFYGLAQILESAFRIPVNTLGQLTIPKVSSIGKSRDDIQRVYKQYMGHVIFITLSLLVIGFFIVPRVIPYIFGEAYRSSIDFFRGLLVGMFFWSLYAVKATMLLGIGQVKYNSSATVFICTFNVISSIILILYVGPMGAVYGTILSYVLGCIGQLIFYPRALDKYLMNQVPEKS